MFEFRSKHNTLVIKIQTKIGTKTIEFINRSDKGGYYLTDDKETAELLRSHAWYGRDFYLYGEDKEPVDIIPKVEAKQPDEDEVEIFDDVKTISEAREILRQKGVIIQKLRTPASILKYANEMKIEFPNITI